MNETNEMASGVNPIALTLVSLVLLLGFIAAVMPTLTNHLADDYVSKLGVTATVDGTIYNKQYIAAHNDTYTSLFNSFTKYSPEEWQIRIRRYDTSVKKWETADFSIDKATYDMLKVGDHYTDPLKRTAFFQYDS